MSNYTKTFKIETEFEGDKVVCYTSRMKRKDALKLLPYISNEPDKDGNVTMSFDDQLKVMDVAGDLLPKYVNSFNGLTDKQGEPLSIDDVVEETYFMPLLGELVQELVMHSFMNKEDEKKSKEVPASSSAATDTIDDIL